MSRLPPQKFELIRKMGGDKIARKGPICSHTIIVYVSFF